MWANGLNASSTKLHERPGIQSQAAAAAVTRDTDMVTSLRDRLVRTRIPNNVEVGGGQRASTLFNIHDNKRNVEWLLKKSLNAFNPLASKPA